MYLHQSQKQDYFSFLALLQEKDQNTVKAIVDRLTDKKIVVRKTNPNDGRAFLLSLTEHGKTLFSKISEVDDTFMDSVLQGISPEELNAFTKVLNMIEKNTDR